MEIKQVKHNAVVLVGDYPFAKEVKEEVLSLFKRGVDSVGYTNVKASLHTNWNWEPDNVRFRNLKEYIREEIETYYKIELLEGHSFWGMSYEKGDYAQSHSHKPSHYSFAYFVSAKWYHSPLVFTYSKKRIRPKEGRFIAFPSYLMHHVPKHRYNDVRITLSGNYRLNREGI